MPSHLLEHLMLKRQIWQGCGQERTPVSCRQECKLVQPLGKTVWRFLKKRKKKKTSSHKIHQTRFWVFIQRKQKILTWEDVCTPVFTVALVTIAKIRTVHQCDEISVCQWMKGEIRCDRYIQWDMVPPLKEGNPAIGNNMDGSQWQYVW